MLPKGTLPNVAGSHLQAIVDLYKERGGPRIRQKEKTRRSPKIKIRPRDPKQTIKENEIV